MRDDDARPQMSTGATSDTVTTPQPVQSTGTFASLSVHNYRLYFGGQAVSLVGTWMQATAQAWLVLTLSGSSSILGVIVALQALPILIIGPYAGVSPTASTDDCS